MSTAFNFSASAKRTDDCTGGILNVVWVVIDQLSYHGFTIVETGYGRVGYAENVRNKLQRNHHLPLLDELVA
jgi:hypothetical protein